MRSRWPLALVSVGILLASCGDDEPSASDRDWAAQATLEIARVNDVMALEFLPALLGDAYAGEPVVVVDETPTPNWADLRVACARLAPLVPGIDAVAAEAPERYADAGESLETYGVTLARVAAGCERAAEEEDFELLRDEVNADIEALGALAVDIGLDLPADIECPDVAEERPETCDA